MIYAVGTGRVIANAASPWLGRRFEDQSEGWASRFADRAPVSPGSTVGEEPVPGMTCGEVGRLSHPFDEIRVRRAVNKTDLEKVYEVRYRGYAKYFSDPMQVREPLGQTPGCVLLLATDAQDHALGTLRILDRRRGAIELDSYLDVDQLLPEGQHPVAEATRYSVPANPASKWIKLALCKAYFQYCRDTLAKTMLIWIRKCAEREYQRMLFERVNSNGGFSHPRLGAVPHQTWMLDVQTAPARYRASAYPLYQLLYEAEHPNIRYN